MPVTGNQIKAARALAGMDQKALADAAAVGINTIRNFEGWADKIVRGRIDTLEAIKSAFDAAGVQFLEHGEAASGAGVVLKGSKKQ